MAFSAEADAENDKEHQVTIMTKETHPADDLRWKNSYSCFY